VRLGELGKLKNKIVHLNGTGTRDLPACSIVLQRSERVLKYSWKQLALVGGWKVEGAGGTVC
jgi:hypothetical protein